MNYVDGFLLPVPTKNVQIYRCPSTSSVWSTAGSRSWSTPRRKHSMSLWEGHVNRTREETLPPSVGGPWSLDISST